MSQRSYNFVPGEFYHIYNRGTDRRVIFIDHDDYKRFQTLLYILNTRTNINVRDVIKEQDNPYERDNGEALVAIGAYCLMPNHFHLLVTPLEDINLSLFMQKLLTSYAMYFNRKYKRTGGLFEGKFKSQLVEEDRYLKYLFSYIHLNPIKLLQSDWKERGIDNIENAVKYLNEYNYSSYSEATGEVRQESVILKTDLFPVYFEGVKEAQEEVKEWLSFSLGKT